MPQLDSATFDATISPIDLVEVDVAGNVLLVEPRVCWALEGLEADRLFLFDGDHTFDFCDFVAWECWVCHAILFHVLVHFQEGRRLPSEL